MGRVSSQDLTTTIVLVHEPQVRSIGRTDRLKPQAGRKPGATGVGQEDLSAAGIAIRPLSRPSSGVSSLPEVAPLCLQPQKFTWETPS
jgi:hypothetical protein